MSKLTEGKVDPHKYYRDFLSHNVRPDGRLLNEFRPMSLNVNSIKNADGSSIVKIGNSAVVCGIKAELAKPKAETPNEGYLVANVELPPLCSSLFQPGPPSDAAQVASKFLADTLFNAKCINLKDLCVYPDSVVWCLNLDVICLNHDAALLDASVIAAVAALKTLTLPHVQYDPDSCEKLVDLSVQKYIQVHSCPVPSTFAVFENDKILSDPSMEEEMFSTGMMTVTVQAETGSPCGIHHPGSSPLTPELLDTCIAESVNKSKLVQDLINSAINSPDR